MNLDRRTVVAGLAATSAALLLPKASAAADQPGFRLATFQADITPPIGHPLLGGLRPAAKSIKDRLEARGIILLGGDKPLVIAALDWCELRNEAYESFRVQIASTANTSADRVLLTCIHQHDAPYLDLDAQDYLKAAGLPKTMHEPLFVLEVLADLSRAVRKSLRRSVPVTHVAVGSAEVQRIACNRRVELTPGKPTFNRLSFTSDPAVRDAPDGAIDPKLQTLGFYNGDKLVATISVYAVHPMSYYGQGEVSYDFPGMARAMLDKEQSGVFHLYVSGCSGDVVAAKYNDGNEAARLALAQRLASAMSQSIKNLERHPLKQLAFRNVPLQLPPPEDGALAPERLRATIEDKSLPASQRITAALGYSYWQRCQKKPDIDLPAIDFGPAAYLVLPAEMFVEYQLAAQKLAPQKHVLIAGFGECAPGYIPTEKARREGFVEEHQYCWNKPGAEEVVMAALKRALDK